MSGMIAFQSAISVEEFCRLREAVGFQRLTVEQARKVLSNTSIVINAVYQEKSVGVVRILTDMVTDAYITDVMIDPDFQGMGLGRKMMEQVIAYFHEYSVSSVKLACCLYANPNKELFYEKFGFEKLPNDKYGYGMLLEL